VNDTRSPLIDSASRWRISLGALVALVITAAAGAAAWTWVRADVAATKSDVATHETAIKAVDARLRVLEAAQTDIAVMRNDVQWIRRELERRHQP